MQPFKEPIYISRPYLPPLSDFVKGLEEIWANRWLSNGGPILKRFEKKLVELTNSQNVSLFANGSLALEIALQGLGISGEVITTPFTFAATTHALTRNGLKPVFADIEPDRYTLDPDKVSAAITPKTSAILGVHMFGAPCKLDELASIAESNGLLLIYDAAHAFGVTVNSQPIGTFGDVTMFSFHATKPFHTIEGGCLVFADSGLKAKFEALKNNGFENETEVGQVGTNAKMNEFQALMGEQMLEQLTFVTAAGKKIEAVYRERLEEVPGVSFSPPPAGDIQRNYSFVAIQIHEEAFGMGRDDLYCELNKYNVYPRKYFYPLVPDTACYKDLPNVDPLTTARGVADRILALPIYPELEIDDVNQICDIVVTAQRKQ